jgi:hypothetical protein
MRGASQAHRAYSFHIGADALWTTRAPTCGLPGDLRAAAARALSSPHRGNLSRTPAGGGPLRWLSVSTRSTYALGSTEAGAYRSARSHKVCPDRKTTALGAVLGRDAWAVPPPLPMRAKMQVAAMVLATPALRRARDRRRAAALRRTVAVGNARTRPSS